MHTLQLGKNINTRRILTLNINRNSGIIFLQAAHFRHEYYCSVNYVKLLIDCSYKTFVSRKRPFWGNWFLLLCYNVRRRQIFVALSLIYSQGHNIVAHTNNSDKWPVSFSIIFFVITMYHLLKIQVLDGDLKYFPILFS